MAKPVQSVWYKKILLVAFSLGFVLPIALIPFLSLFGGAFVLWAQWALFREDGRRYSLSTFEAATRTVNRKLADRLRYPALSSCQGVETRLAFVKNRRRFNAAELNAAVKKLCPQMAPFQYWLLHPVSRTDLHKAIVPALNAIPVSFLLFLVALFFLRLLSAMTMNE